MIIRSFKNIDYLKFNLTKTKYFLIKDYFYRQDLIEALTTLILNKKRVGEAEVKWGEVDSLYDSKKTKIMVIPSLLDFQKDFIDGSKSLFHNLMSELLIYLEDKSAALIEIQNLLYNFKIENENKLIKGLFDEVKKNLNINLTTNINAGITSMLAAYIELEITNELGDKVDDSNLSFAKFKEIYFLFLKLLREYSSEELIYIFDDPFIGLLQDDIKSLLSILDNVENKFLICSWLPIFDNEKLPNCLVISKDENYDFSNFYNDFADYNFYVDTIDVKKEIDNVLHKFINIYNIYDENYLKEINFESEQQNTLFKVLLNKM